jgi:dTDP-4-amino-4,6-dideoxygalactose transaminase
MASEPEGTELHAGDCPVAERLAGELFTLLVHPTVGTSDLDDVVEAVGKVRSALQH